MTKRALIFSTAYFPLVGGAEVAMKEVTDRLPDWQFDLFCARIKNGLPDTERVGNVTVHRVGFGSTVDKLLFPFWGAWKAAQLPESKNAVAWSLMASYGGYATYVYSLLRPSAKILLTLQEGDPFERYEKHAGIFSFTRKWIFRRAHAVQAISTYLAKWATDMGFSGKPEIIPNGVTIETFTARISSDERAKIRAVFGYADSDTVLVTTSRLSLKNGVDDLVRSLSHLDPSYKALIIGEGEDEADLKKLTSDLGLTARVNFLGKKTHAELPSLLQASDIFCRPSLSEGLGNSFLEAMAAGLPIIGTPVGGIPDFLTDGETGLFCQPRNPESIAAAAMRLHSDPALREKISHQGEALVRAKYDWNGVANAIGNMLSALSV